jgi:hypothetical protein
MTAKLLGVDQTIRNGAAYISFLLITHQYIGATNKFAPVPWRLFFAAQQRIAITKKPN